MGPAERRRGLDALLVAGQGLWRPQPFREARPAWCAEYPALTETLLGLDEVTCTTLNDDAAAARQWLGRHLRGTPAGEILAEVAAWTDLPMAAGSAAKALPTSGHWAWEIPGRKQAQIEAFARAASPSGYPVLDWCGGKGHLGRLLALGWQVPVESLDIDPALCAAGQALARRARGTQSFRLADALIAGDGIAGERHVVALHACGDLHRRAIQAGVQGRVAALDIAPCCYHRGVATHYMPLAPRARLALSRDDLRLAVTETVTASPRLARQRDQAMAWKLGFAALRRELTGVSYQTFKPVPAEWLRADFPSCCRWLAEREGLKLPEGLDLAPYAEEGWRRQREVLRLSILRHAFRRPLEIWLALDLACHLEESGYAVSLATFCERRVTPRNLLLSARR